MNTNKKIIIGSLMGCIFGATVGYSASIVSLPHTFTAGTPIKASEVNENFTALANSIESLKTNNGYTTKSSSFVEENLTAIEPVVGTTVNTNNNSYLIKQLDFESPITGKKYSLKYPSNKKSSSTISLYATNCLASRTNQLIVKQINVDGAKIYLSLANSLITLSDSITGGTRTNIYIQIGDICGDIWVENSDILSVDKYSKVETDKFIARATELSKYIYVKSL